MERKNPLIIDFLMQIETNAPIYWKEGNVVTLL